MPTPYSGRAKDEENDERLHDELRRPTCVWGGTTPAECAMTRERSVAGTSDMIPDCPEHGAFPDEAFRYCEYETCLAFNAPAAMVQTPDGAWYCPAHAGALA